MTVNERIINLMKQRDGMSQKKLGDAINVSASTINNWLSLGRSIPAEYIKPIASVLGVSCEYLLTGNENGNLSEEESDWLSLINRLPDNAKPVIKGELEGYLNTLDKKK